MKSKRDKPETYPLSEEQFTQFAKALVSVPKKELDKQIDKHNKRRVRAKERRSSS
jgi:hypothetical protein